MGCSRVITYVCGLVYHDYHLILCVPHGILSIIITMECHCGQDSLTNCWNVGAMFRPSKIDDRCVDLRGSMIDVSTFEDRCADLRRLMVIVSTFEDHDRCEIMLLHLLITLMVYLYANNCAKGLHCCVCVSIHICRITHWNHTTGISMGSQQCSDRFKFCQFS